MDDLDLDFPHTAPGRVVNVTHPIRPRQHSGRPTRGVVVDGFVPIEQAAVMDDGVRCMIMRGGTSKGAYFLEEDLPPGPVERDRLLLDLVGSPDPRQIDGIGGAHPLTTKVAVISVSERPDADVDYLFLQPSITEASVSHRQNCGNILAGVGPFAVERGLVRPEGDEAMVRIHMRNTDSRATARFAVRDGRPVYDGDASISGVPGTAAPIRLDFADLAGGSCGSLLPTDSAVDVLDGVECTLIDNGMPVVVFRAADVGITGYEACAELEADTALRDRLEVIRREAGPLMNLGDVADTTVPKLTMVAAPRAGGALCTRTFIPHRCHEAIGVLGAVSVATAALLPGTPAASVVDASAIGSSLPLEHPTGVFEVLAALHVEDDGTAVVDQAGIIRTARKLMDGVVFPRGRS
jgi:4-oxalomesaconate tautomerase